MADGLRTSLLLVIAAGILGWVLPRRILAKLLEGIRAFSRGLATLAIERPKVTLLIVWIVALVPMIHQTLVVRHYGVNVPTFDDWATAPLIVKAHTGQLRVTDIFQQQQEARTVLPNLIFILSAWHEWNVRDQMLVSVISSALTAGCVFILLRRSRLNLPALAICFWLIVLTLFSPAPFELWIFASGFPSFLPLLFLVTASVVIGTPISILWKFLACVALAVASTFTLAHGMLAWGLTFPLLLISRRLPRWRLWLGLWLVAAAIFAAAYFWGYEKPAYLPQFAPRVSLLDYAHFILEFLGGGLAFALKNHAEMAATIFGSVQVGLLVLAMFVAGKRFRDREFIASVLPWFALTVYSLGSAFLAALGRVGFGVSYATSSRYVPFSIGLTIGVIALTAIVFGDFFKRVHAPAWRAIAATILILGLLVPYRSMAANTLFFLRARSANDRQGKGAVVFSQVIDSSALIRQKVFPPAAESVVQNAAALDDLKLLRPPLARSNRLSALPHEEADGKQAAGMCETIVAEGESYHASGWAVLKGKRRSADCVLVSYEAPGMEPILFAISDSLVLRWDIARWGWPNDYLWSGWTATFPRAAIPPNAKFTFWAVDVDEPKLYRLEEKHR